MGRPTAAAWEELDNKVIECKEFEDRNRGHFEQIMTDIARLGEQIADLQRVISETVEFINTKDLEIISVQAKLKEETTIYLRIYYQNKQDMTIRRNDLAVFQFMLKLTKCKTAVALAQLSQHQETSSANMCNTAQGVVFDFEDDKAQQKLERMMTPSARAAIRAILGRMDMVRANQGAALLQQEARSAPDDDDGSSDEDRASQNDDKESKALSALKVSEHYYDSDSTTMAEAPPPKASMPT